MFGKRSQDPTPRTYFRAERFSLINGFYYFSTRENTLEGPFPSRSLAELASIEYVERLAARNESRETRADTHH